MNIGGILEKLGIDPQKLPLDFLQEVYDASLKNDDAGELNPEKIRDICQWIGFRDDLALACFDAAREIQVLPEACEFLRTLRCLTLDFYSDERLDRMPWSMPCPNRWRSPSMLYLVMFLSCVPHLQKLHREQGVPEWATKEILLDLESKIDIFIRQHGYPGLGPFRWFAEHVNGRIFHLGRLQFQFASFYAGVNVFKHVSEDKLAVLAMPGQKFRPDGQYFDADRQIVLEESVRTSTLTDDGTWITGTPITARGSALPDDIRLRKSEWISVFKQGDPVLNVHIPANTSRNGPLTREACADSFRKAIEFFPRYFPEFVFNAFMCHTWMLDVQLSDLLPANSKVVGFQNWYHLLPMPAASDAGIIMFVFGEPFPGWDAVTPKTSLQEIAVRHVREGNSWRVGGGFCLKEEILNDIKYPLICGGVV